MTDLEREVFERIAEAINQAGPIQGVLFHGTGEPIEGPLRPGPDGLLWTSSDPVMAQQYIPDSGLKAACHYPLSFEWDHRVLPNRNSMLYKLAVMMTGIEPSDVKRDSMGRATSWSIPDGWPTNAEVIAYLEDELGYEREDFGGVWIKTTFEGNQEVIKHNDWRLQGELFITVSDGLSFKDLRNADEGDLMEPDHRRYDDFSSAEREGYDGVIINDFAQVESLGNVGHVAFGINANGLKKLSWFQLPAINFDMAKHEGAFVTHELASWIEEVSEREALAYA